MYLNFALRGVVISSLYLFSDHVKKESEQKLSIIVINIFNYAKLLCVYLIMKKLNNWMNLCFLLIVFRHLNKPTKASF